MPNEVTVEDIEEAYKLSWELGLKAMALYRDGSKASQPLSSATSGEGDHTEDEAVELNDAIDERIEPLLVPGQRDREFGDRTPDDGPEDEEDQHDHRDDDQRRDDGRDAPALHPEHGPNGNQCKENGDEKRDEQVLGHLHAVDDNNHGGQGDDRVASLFSCLIHVSRSSHSRRGSRKV